MIPLMILSYNFLWYGKETNEAFEKVIRLLRNKKILFESLYAKNLTVDVELSFVKNPLTIINKTK